MKKTCIYLLGLTLSFGITACGNANTEASSDSPAIEEMEMEATHEMEADTEDEIEEAEASVAAPVATPAPKQAKSSTETAPKATMNKKEAAVNSNEMISDEAPVAVEQPKKTITNAIND